MLQEKTILIIIFKVSSYIAAPILLAIFYNFNMQNYVFLDSSKTLILYVV